ncbi:unnamed protein product [marine sediment metagenome]|uniref:Uncharacterized protein n=1 Tax=marine sediment metagenome TaxID=412755 RepID=X1J4U9_9ZZZZ
MPSLKEAIEKISASFFCSGKDSCTLLKQVSIEGRELKAENEKLREIFEFATLEFEKRNRKIAFLQGRAKRERYYHKRVKR